MDKQPVLSKNIASVSYDDANEILEISFVSGRTYSYSNVSRETYDAFMQHPSKGYFFHHVIKGKFPYKEI